MSEKEKIKPKKKIVKGSFLDRKIKETKRKLKAERRIEPEIADEDIEDDVPIEDSEDDDDVPVAPVGNTFKLFGHGGGHASVRGSNMIFRVNGKNVVPEVAFNTMNTAAWMAAFYVMMDTNPLKKLDLDDFMSMAIQMVGLYGPLNDVSVEAVEASIFHIREEQLDVYQTIREKREEIRGNLPRAVGADAVVRGVTAMDMDLQTAEVSIVDHEDLAYRAESSMATLNQALYTKPGSAALETIAEIGGLTAHLQPIEGQIESMIDGASLPSINETNVFRKVSDHPGLMANFPVAQGKHGLLQEAYTCLTSYLQKPPDVLIVPNYNITITGNWKSHKSASRIIPLPDDPKLMSLTLMSIVDKYQDGLRRAADIEARLAEEKGKGDERNARAMLHAEYQEEYENILNTNVGVTNQGVQYVTLYGHKPLTKKGYVEAMNSNLLDVRPALMRASDYYQLCKDGKVGEFVFIDMPQMIGLFFTHNYIKRFFNVKNYVAKSCLISPKKGWYVFAHKIDRFAKTYSTILSKYMFAFLCGKISGDDDVQIQFMDRFFGDLRVKPKNNATALNIIKKLDEVFGKIQPPLASITILFPGYSATKALKYATHIVEMSSSEDESSEEVMIPTKRRKKKDLDVDIDEHSEESADYVSSDDEDKTRPQPSVPHGGEGIVLPPARVPDEGHGGVSGVGGQPA